MPREKYSKLTRFLRNSLSVQPSAPGTGLTKEEAREFDNYFQGKGMSREFFLKHYRPRDSFSLAPSKITIMNLMHCY